MLVSWWDLAVPLAIRLCVRKVLQTLLSSFDDLFHADKNFSLVYHCAQPAPHPIVEMPMADTQMEDAIFVLAASCLLEDF